MTRSPLRPVTRVTSCSLRPKQFLQLQTTWPEFEARRAELEKKAQEALDQANGRAQALEGFSLTITAKAGDEGKLFGSIGSRDIAEAMSAAGQAIEKSEVILSEGPLRNVGEHEVRLQLHPEVSQNVVINVEAGDE